MREKISRKLLFRLEKHMPERFRRRQLQILMNLAAGSFGMPKERLCRESPSAALSQYASFTCRCMDKGAAEGETLFRDAYRLGRRIRQITGLKEDEDLKRLITLLYRNIGISMSIAGTPGTQHTGEFVVSNCYFSRWYSPSRCRLMSFVDAGIISGICGGGDLRFRQRMTEGCGFCSAQLTEDRERFRERGSQCMRKRLRS